MIIITITIIIYQLSVIIKIKFSLSLSLLLIVFHFFHFIRFYSLQKALERHQTKEKEKDAELAFMDGRLRHAHEVTQVVEPKIHIVF